MSSSAEVTLDLLGALSVRHGDATLSGAQLGGRRARLALAFLATAGGPVTSSRLAHAIWADDLPATWAVALRGVVRGIRLAGATVGLRPDDLVVTTGAGYGLAGGVRVPLVELRARAERARELLRTDPRAALDELDRLTPGVQDVDPEALLPGEQLEWAEGLRERLASAWSQVLTVRARALLALSEPEQAAAVACRLVEAAPLDESGHQLLITALHAGGDRAAAVRAYHACRSLLADQLGVDPSPQTLELYLQALAEPPAAPGRIPRTSATFVGRQAELAALLEAIDRPGVVSLLGPAGVGKSRLAQEAARSASSRVDERFWVALGAAGDEEVPTVVAAGLGVRPGPGDPAEALVDHLVGRGRALLVLDGCERATDGVVGLVATLVAGCPELTVLLTGLGGPGIGAERRIAVRPWAVPVTGDPAAFAAAAPVRLLVERVRGGGGRLTGAHPEALATIVELCGGLPLALELVAARLGEIGPGDLCDELVEARRAGADGVLAPVVSSSIALLDEAEAAVLRRLAVLEGPLSLGVVRDVVAFGAVSSVRVPRLLATLDDRALLRVDSTGPHWSYDLDDQVREHAWRLLRAADEEETAFARLADHVRTVLPDDARRPASTFEAAIDELGPSVRALLRWSATRPVRDDGLEIVFRLHRYWAAAHLDEGRRWADRLLDGARPCTWTPYAAFAAGYLGYWSGRTAEAVAHLTAAARDLPDAGFRARALVYLAGLHDDDDRADEAVRAVAEAVATAPDDEPDLQVSALMGIACVLAERAAPAAADRADEAVARCRSTASPAHLSSVLPTAAMVCWQVGAVDRAAALVDEAMSMHEGERRIATVVLNTVAAAVALQRGDAARAVDLAGRADEVGTAIGVGRELPLARAVLALAALDDGDVDRAALAARGALEAAATQDCAHPAAAPLEVAAAVLAARAEERSPGPSVRAALAAAAAIRARGDRPGAPGWVAGIGRWTVRPVPADVRAADVRLADAVPAHVRPADVGAAVQDAIAALAG